MFGNRSIIGKLVSGFVVIVLLIVVVLSIFYFSNTSMKTNFTNLMEVEVAISNFAGNAESQMLQCRRNEKDFILRKDKQYLGKMEKSIAQLKQNAKDIKKVAYQSGMPDIEKSADSILTYADLYYINFQELVKAYETKGLDHNSGCQREFSDAAHSIQNQVVEHQADNLYLALLQIRRYEKDYLLSSDEKYIKKTFLSISRFQEALTESNILKEHKTGFNKHLEDYKIAFNNLFIENQEIAVLTASMRDSARKIEHIVAGLKKHTMTVAKKKLNAVEANAKTFSTIALIAGLAAIAIGITLAFIIIRNIRKVVNDIRSSADYVAASSQELSSSSQQISQEANEKNCHPGSR